MYDAFKADARAYEPGESITVCRDANDDHILEVAVSAGANYLITGDQDLLVLDPFRGIRIVTPRQFLELVEP